MLGLALREEFRSKRHKGTAIELSDDTYTVATQIAAREFLEITYPTHESMSGVHRAAALLHCWLLGTYHGDIQPKQLDYYFDEFVFRFNRRTSKSRGLLFYRSVATHPVTYDDVTEARNKLGET